MEDCEESIFDKGETSEISETREMKAKTLPNKKEENAIKKVKYKNTSKKVENTKKGYSCTKCSSLIQILSINENNNNIEFECTNKKNTHRESISIEEYLRNRNKNNINDNGDVCGEHKEKFISYCLECNIQLCIKCQKNGIHISHKKVNLIEIEPSQEELTIFKQIIDYYCENVLKKRKYLNDELLFHHLKELEKNKKKEIELKVKKLKKIEKQKNLELKKCKKEYLTDLNKIKEKYEKEIKKRKAEYEIMNNRIINEYKLKKDKIDLIYLKKNDKLERLIDDKYRKFRDKMFKELSKKLYNIKNLNDLNEIVYNTYNEYKNNFIYAININTMILEYYQKSEYIRNNIIKKNIKNDGYDFINLIKRKIEPFKKKPMMNCKIKIKKNEKFKKKILNFQSNSKPNLNPKSNSKKDVGKNLFNLFNNIFFKNKEQTSINGEKINELQKEFLRNKYFNFKKEKKEQDLIRYFDDFIKANVLKVFEKEDIDIRIIDNLIFNIETILDCFEMNKYFYKKYYYPKNNKNMQIGGRKKSFESSERFRTTFNIDENIIKEEELLKRLDKNDNDIYKVFQQIYG